MESLRYPSSLLLPFLSLIILSSISTSLSHLSLAPEISPAASPSPTPQPQTYEEVSDPPAESQPDISSSKSVFFHHSSGHLHILKKICESTDYPSLCIATIGPHLKKGRKCDIITILGVAMNVTIEATKLGVRLANRISTMPGTPPDIASILKDCKDSYEDALANFQEAVAALPSRDIGKMNSMLSAVITDVTDCEDEFSGNLSPLTNYADKIANMTSNCLAIVSLIPDHQ